MGVGVGVGVGGGVVGRKGMGEHMSCLRLCSEQSARSTLETFAFLFVTSTDCTARDRNIRCMQWGDDGGGMGAWARREGVGVGSGSGA